MARVRSKPSNMYFSLYKPQLQKVELKEIKIWISSRCTLTPWGCGPASQEAPARLKSPVGLCMKDEMWARTYLLSEERSPSGGTWLRKELQSSERSRDSQLQGGSETRNDKEWSDADQKWNAVGMCEQAWRYKTKSWDVMNECEDWGKGKRGFWEWSDIWSQGYRGVIIPPLKACWENKTQHFSTLEWTAPNS